MAQVFTFTGPPHPGLTPPPGKIPDFDDPFTLATYQTLAVAACFIITTTVVGARMYTKRNITRKVTWEDCERP